jgi:large repetitive protein
MKFSSAFLYLIIGILFFSGNLFAQVPPTEVIIMEVFDYPGTTSSPGEFVEIYNTGSTAKNLDGWRLVQANSSFTTTLNSSSLQSGDLTLNPGEYAVIGRGSVAQFAEIWGYIPSTYFSQGNSSSQGAPQIDGDETYQLWNATSSGLDRFGGANLTFSPELRHYTRNMITYPNSGYNLADWITDPYYGNPGTDNLSPNAANDAVSTPEEKAIAIRILDNDNDLDGYLNSSTVTIVLSAAHGKLEDFRGVITYTPEPDFFGNDKFTYNVKDNDGAVSNTATVTISVTNINDAPVAVDDRPRTSEDIPVKISVLANDSDPDGSSDIDPASIVVVKLPANGKITNYDTKTGSLTYSPDKDYNGSDAFVYNVKDRKGLQSNNATVSIDIRSVNDRPVAVDDRAEVNEDSEVSIPVLANDYDVDGALDYLSLTLTLSPAHGKTSVDIKSGRVLYTPDKNYYGEDTFNYTVKDNSGAVSNTGVVKIVVNPVNDPPIARDDVVSTNEDAAVSIPVLNNDEDIDGNPVLSSVAVISKPLHGSATVNTKTGEVLYSPNKDYFGTDAFTYNFKDNSGALSNTAKVNISIRSVNDPPIAVSDRASTDEDQAVNIDVLINDSDPDGQIDPTSVVITSNPANGTTSVDAKSGLVRYTPNKDYNGQDTFYYTVRDNSGSVSKSTQVSVEIKPVNDPPVANDDEAVTEEDRAVLIRVLDNDVDIDSKLNVASVVVTSSPANGKTVVNSDFGMITYTPNANFNGNDKFSYTVRDDSGVLSNAATVFVSVSPVNDLPVARDDKGTVDEDKSVVITVLSNDADPDGSLVPSSVKATTPKNGTANVNTTNGSITYSPNKDYNGLDQFTYTVEDNEGGLSNTATVNIIVNSVNDAPVAVDDVAETDEEKSVIIAVLKNDLDVDGSLVPSTVKVTSGPANGTTGVNTTTGEVTYTPKADFNGKDSFTYIANDDGGAVSNTATVNITINPVNDPPVAADDNAKTDEDKAVVISVLANDNDPDGSLAPSTVLVSSGPANGTTGINISTGAITYTPNLNFNGQDSFTYTVKDNQGAASNTAKVTVTVNPVNDLPVAKEDFANTNEDIAVEIKVLDNDTDVDGTLVPASVKIGSSPANGTTGINTSTGAITYTPSAGWSGVDNFTYTVDDNNGGTSNAANVRVTVGAVNDPPMAKDDIGTTDEDKAVAINVLANDSDSDGSLVPSTVKVASGAANGTTSVNTTSGEVTYTPKADFNGKDSFTYTVNDDGGAVSNTATVNITINPVNDPPVAADDNAKTDEDKAVVISVMANDNDPDGSLAPSTVLVSSGPANGTTGVNISTGAITYTPKLNFNGQDSFTYTVKDNQGAASNTAKVTITVSPVNDLPVAKEDFANTNEDIAVEIKVLDNDTDVDGTLVPSSVKIGSAPANGTTGINTSTGAITYTPSAGWSGVDNFTYTVDDNNGGTSNAANVRVTVGAVNDPPVAKDDMGTTDEDKSVAINVLANDLDSDGSLVPSTVKVTSGPANGTTSVNTTTGEVTYTPKADFNGKDSFTYVVSDDGGAVSNTATVNITINAVNDPPVAADDNAKTDEDKAVVISVLANDSDSDGTLDPASVKVISGPANGTTTVNPSSGAVTYTPNAGWNGNDAFTYTVADDKAAVSNTATVRINVGSVNDPPVAVDDEATTDEDKAVTIAVLDNDSDSDGSLDPATVIVTNAPAHGKTTLVPSTGEITYTPDLNYNGDDSFIYTVKDNNGAVSNKATVKITVSGVNDPPVALNDKVDTNEDTPVAIDILNNDSDVDGSLSAASIVITSGTINGTTDVNLTTGIVTYTPKTDFNGNDSFTYTVKDNDGAASNSATVDITVKPINDVPQAKDDFAETNEDTPVDIDVLANDSDMDGTLDPASVKVIDSPANGSYSVNSSNGQISFTPKSGWSGIDNLTYTVADNQGAISTKANVRIKVGAVNDPPVAVNDKAATDEDLAIEIAVLANDFDTDGALDPATVTIKSAAANGSTNINITTGSVTYTPAADYYGTDTFSYSVKDDAGATSNTAVVTINISSINDVPVAQNDDAGTAEDTPVDIDILANDSDKDGTLAPSSVATANGPANGAVKINVNNGIITYTPNAGWSGTDTFDYTVKDNQNGESNTATVAIKVDAVNDPPVIADLPDVAFLEDDSLMISFATLYSYVEDPDNLDEELAPNLFGVKHLSLKIDNDGVIIRAPVNWFGEDTVLFAVSDGALSDTASIAVAVISVNDIPMIEKLPDTVTVKEGQTEFLSLWDFVRDIETPDNQLLFNLEVDNDSLNYMYQKENGTLSLSLLSGYDGSAVLKITVRDDSLATVSDSVIVRRPDVTSVLDDAFTQIPKVYDLKQNYPNPFNPQTTIAFDLPKASDVHLTVYNILGQRVAILANDKFGPGSYKITFDAQALRLASGVYIYRLRAGEYVQQKKMVIMK